MIQHPHGKAKRFALRNNLAIDADESMVWYLHGRQFRANQLSSIFILTTFLTGNESIPDANAIIQR